jgi:hypothetical protein
LHLFALGKSKGLPRAEKERQHGSRPTLIAKSQKQKLRIGETLHLQWFKCAGAGEWCLLNEVEVAEGDASGVFVVWRPGDLARTSVVMYVGRGPLRQRIEECRRDPIMRASHELRVTWATVDRRDVDGVAAYLYQQLRPLWGEVPRSPPAPQPVNLPLTA